MEESHSQYALITLSGADTLTLVKAEFRQVLLELRKSCKSERAGAGARFLEKEKEKR